ncbi:MAG: tripartite tricarboxylate transporter TctB family protein [Hyphomicrobiales bacterium]
MSLRIFDLLLLLIGAAFTYQAIQTPPENYDVMGPSLWPLSVALSLLVLLVLSSVFSRQAKSDREAPLNIRFWLMCLAMIALVAVQLLAIMPFFLSAAAFCLCAFLLMTHLRDVKSLLQAGSAALVFSYLVQYVFTQFINLDLTTTF